MYSLEQSPPNSSQFTDLDLGYLEIFNNTLDNTEFEDNGFFIEESEESITSNSDSCSDVSSPEELNSIDLTHEVPSDVEKTQIFPTDVYIMFAHNNFQCIPEPFETSTSRSSEECGKKDMVHMQKVNTLYKELCRLLEVNTIGHKVLYKIIRWMIDFSKLPIKLYRNDKRCKTTLLATMNQNQACFMEMLKNPFVKYNIMQIGVQELKAFKK